LKDAYVWLRQYDKDYSAKHNFPTSIKLTTVKPSGTLSLLAGVTPGVHPNPAGPFYIRRIRISSQSPLVEVCRQHGYHIEYQRKFDGSEDKSTMVISFPCKLPATTPVAADYDWKTQMDMVRRMQAEWSDNSVSCTVYYKKEDIEDIKKYLKEHFRHEMKTVSFLLYHGHGFDQAPYETITEDQYNEMVKNIKPITSVEVKESEMELAECEGGACPVK
jgi:ribonucleotide reductase alpha subunit